jgi:hypothetical protein
MNKVNGTMLGLAILMGGWACPAQTVTIPFGRFEQDVQLSAKLTLPGNELASGSSSSTLSPEVSNPALGAGFIRVAPLNIQRTLDSKYFLLNGLHLGMAVLDVEMTQHCIAAHKCREGNPLMPSSQAGQLGLNIPLVGFGSFVSYRLKKRGSRVWWLSPTTGTVAHAAGAVTGFIHR